jgi:hypothetical protein
LFQKKQTKKLKKTQKIKNILEDMLWVKLLELTWAQPTLASQ